VLDACMDKGMGVVADVFVQWGQLHVGDAVVIGTSFGRVKSMKDHLVRPLQCLLH
jgi:translation initiation factor IF-2